MTSDSWHIICICDLVTKPPIHVDKSLNLYRLLVDVIMRSLGIVIVGGCLLPQLGPFDQYIGCVTVQRIITVQLIRLSPPLLINDNAHFHMPLSFEGAHPQLAKGYLSMFPLKDV